MAAERFTEELGCIAFWLLFVAVVSGFGLLLYWGLVELTEWAR